MSGCFSRSIYVGNLPGNIREHEIKDLFYKYGRIVDMELKVPPRPPCYCFVEFERARAAEDATRGRDGYNFDGCRLRVELAHGGRRQSSNDRRGGYCGGGGRSAWFGGVSRRSEFRVIVRGLPSSASWQDLKDHMRKAGDVCFAEVTRDNRGTYGVVDYTNYDDMKYAIRKLDDTEFRNPWARGYIRVKKHESSQSKSPIRSRSRSHSRGRDHSSRLFQERQKNSSTTLGPSQPLSQVPESNNDAFCHMTVEKLVPENELRTMLDPKHQGNSTWFGISNNDITKFILKMLHSIFDKPYTRFKDIPSEERQMLFKMFAQKFTWDPTNTKLVEKEFEKEIALQFSYNVNRWKENWKKEKEKPKGLNESVWNKFISYWQSSDTESISKSCSENWKSDPGDKRMYIQDVWSTSCLRRNEELQKFGGVVSDHLQFLKDVDTNKKVDDIRDGFGNEIIKNMEKEVDILSQQHSQRDSCSSPELPKDEINPLEISGSKRCGRRLAKVAVSKDTTSSVKFLNCNEDLVRDNAELRKAVLELTSSLEEIKKTRLWLMNFIKSKFPELADDFANI